MSASITQFSPALAEQIAARRSEVAAKPRDAKMHKLSVADARSMINVEDNINNIMLLVARLEIAGTTQALHVAETGEIEEVLIPPIDSTPIKAALDARFKLLNKVLPDLKSIEHTGEVQTGLADLLRQAALRASAQMRVIDGSVVDEQPGDVVSSTNHAKLDFF